MDDQRRLLLLAAQVATLDADLGSEAAQAWFTAAIDSLAHALVDLSDGRTQATTAVATPTPASPTGNPERDRASCAAARAELAAVRLALAEIGAGQDRAGSDLVEHTEDCLQFLIAALSETATALGADPSGPSPSAHRNLRAAFRILQPPAPLSS
ncbi:hypothetical protein BH23ACT6_BH23ACT6_18700 [soil metagenome]